MFFIFHFSLGKFGTDLHWPGRFLLWKCHLFYSPVPVIIFLSIGKDVPRYCLYFFCVLSFFLVFLECRIKRPVAESHCQLELALETFSNQQVTFYTYGKCSVWEFNCRWPVFSPTLGTYRSCLFQSWANLCWPGWTGLFEQVFWVAVYLFRVAHLGVAGGMRVVPWHLLFFSCYIKCVRPV